ncbi:hypothetical protein [Saccharothrix hoggarensis]|uniref:Uncharacterized protein n=1 Tax=Saccharothrix hoggarensis TaxID=913853 RepID=A0ABW3R490_9PSEU
MKRLVAALAAASFLLSSGAATAQPGTARAGTAQPTPPSPARLPCVTWSWSASPPRAR